MGRAWGYQTPPRTRGVEDHASRLRTKLRAHGGDYVTNVWGVGYRLVNASDSHDLVACHADVFARYANPETEPA